MFTPLIAALLVQGNGPHTSFATPMEVAEPKRLALTPRIDGHMAEEEWDQLAKTPELESFLQWEPGKVHIAGRLPASHDLVFSFDLKGNGWLVGKDNLEVRIVREEGGPVVKARMLDATNPAGPTWVRYPGLAVASTVAAKEAAGAWTVEATLEEPGQNIFPDKPGKLHVRADAVPREAADDQALTIRAMTALKLDFHRATGLPEGMRWKPEGAGQAVAYNNAVNVRLTFEGKDEMGFKRIDLRSEGMAAPHTNTYGLVFPDFDSKGRAFVDYKTEVRKDIPLGYRVLRATLTSADGAVALGQVSYRVAPALTLELVQEELDSHPEPRKARMTLFIQSNTRNRVDGHLRILPPAGWKLASVSNRSFIVYLPKGRVRRVFELEVPAKARGTFPFVIQAEMGDRTVSETVYVTVR